MIKEVKGDLLDLFDQGEFDIIAHGANCHCLMGSGIAAQIKKRFPSVWFADLYSKMKPIEKFGNFTMAISQGYTGVIVNLYTQYNPGPNADLTAIRMCMKKLAYLTKSLNRSTIGLPLIGCGIGGLDWKDVRIIIEKELKDFDVTIVHYEKVGNTKTI